MSAYTITNSGVATTWVRRDSTGNLVTAEQSQDERLSHVVPPAGEYRMRVTGFAEPFEMARAEQYGGGTQKMTRLELEFVEGGGKGKVCTLLCGWSIGPRSNLGKAYRAITGKTVEGAGEHDVADILGGEFTAYLQPSDKRDDAGKPYGTQCLWDSIRPVGAAAVNGGSDDGELWS